MDASAQTNNLIAILGENGSGKTRILKEIESHLPDGQVECLGAETMIGELVANLRYGETETMLKRYEIINALLVDNLWVLASRPRTAEYVSELLLRRQKKGLLTVVVSDMTDEQWKEKQPAMTEILKSSVKVYLT